MIIVIIMVILMMVSNKKMRSRPYRAKAREMEELRQRFCPHVDFAKVYVSEARRVGLLVAKIYVGEARRVGLLVAKEGRVVVPSGGDSCRRKGRAGGGWWAAWTI